MNETQRLVKKYLDRVFADSPEKGEEEYSVLMDRIRKSLERVQNEEELRFMIEKPLWLDLPFELSNDIFERYLDISNRNPEVLRTYANHLLCHDPKWDDKAAKLKEEAEASK